MKKIDFIKELKDLHNDTEWSVRHPLKFFKTDGNANSDFAEIANVKKKIVRKDFKNESFAEASARLNLTEADQKDAFDYHKNMFTTWGALGSLAMLVLLSVAINHHYLVCLPSIAFMAVALAQCYQASYRCYCINHRSLAGIKAWKRSKEWIPRPFIFKDKTQKALSLSRGKHKTVKSKQKGFALTEVLLAIAVIIVIGVVSYNIYTTSRQKAEIEAVSNMSALLSEEMDTQGSLVRQDIAPGQTFAYFTDYLNTTHQLPDGMTASGDSFYGIPGTDINIQTSIGNGGSSFQQQQIIELTADDAGACAGILQAFVRPFTSASVLGMLSNPTIAQNGVIIPSQIGVACTLIKKNGIAAVGIIAAPL